MEVQGEIMKVQEEGVHFCFSTSARSDSPSV